MTGQQRDETKRLDEALERLPRSVDPAHDLWPMIEAHLQERETRSGRRWAWQAAAAVLLVVGSSVLTANLVRRDEARVARPAAAPAAAVEVEPAAFRAVYAPDPGYVAARQQLAAMLESRVDRLPASARQKLEANLAEIRRATAEITAALSLQPGDPLLEELLLNAYQDELAVLASVNDLTGVNGAAASTDAKGMKL
jgi:hypothetical protein